MEVLSQLIVLSFLCLISHVTPLPSIIVVQNLHFKDCYKQCAMDASCDNFLFSGSTCSLFPGWMTPKSFKGVRNLCKGKVCSRSLGYRKLTGDLCVKVDLSMATWSGSQEVCEKDGATLVLIDSWKTYTVLRKHLRGYRKRVDKIIGNRYWIGMRRYGKGGYHWIPESGSWVKWGAGDPTYGEEECVQLFRGVMGDVRCYNPRHIICQIIGAK